MGEKSGGGVHGICWAGERCCSAEKEGRGNWGNERLVDKQGVNRRLAPDHVVLLFVDGASMSFIAPSVEVKGA